MLRIYPIVVVHRLNINPNQDMSNKGRDSLHKNGEKTYEKKLLSSLIQNSFGKYSSQIG